jgi:leucyl aminopeptidase
MQVTFVAKPLAEVDACALIAGVAEGASPQHLTGGGFAEAVVAVLADGCFTGEEGTTETLYPVPGIAARRVVLTGVGKEEVTAEGWRKAVGAAMTELRGKARSVVIVPPPGLNPVVAAGAAAEAAVLAAYDGRLYQTKKDEKEKPFETLVLIGPEDDRAADAARRGASLGRLVNRARDLSNMPGNKLTPPELKEAALAVGRAYGLETKVFDFEQLKAEGFGCLVGVGQGSVFPPCFVVLEYKGHENPDEPPYVLVGKGITFDTGGICIKPRVGMEEMKTDMHGVATVLGVIAGAAERKLPLNLVVLCPIAENMPSGNALKPGDLVTAYNGLVVEVIDTDPSELEYIGPMCTW